MTSTTTHRRRALATALAATALATFALALAPGASAQKYVHGVVSQGSGSTESKWGGGSPADIAVNRSAIADPGLDPLGDSVDGYVYAVEGQFSSPGINRVQVFDADGEFQFMFGAGVQDGSPTPQVCDRTETPCQGGAPGAQGGMFKGSRGIAIDQGTGHVFVRDRDNRRLQEFEADGDFVRAWGWNVVQEGTTDDTAADEFETCFVAAECQAGEAGANLGQFGSTFVDFRSGIALHAPSGDVIVADPVNSRVQRFAVPASPTDPIPTPLLADAPAVAFPVSGGIPAAIIAIDADNVLYAPASGASTTVQRYDFDTASFLAPIPVATIAGTDPLAVIPDLEISPTSGNLLVALDRSLGKGQPRYSPVVELGAPGGAAGSITHLDTHLTGAVLVAPDADTSADGWNGIGLDPDADRLYLASSQLILRAEEGPAPAATVVFQPHSNIQGASATVAATIERDETLAVDYHLQFAPASAPGDFVTVASGQVAPGAGSSLVSSDLLDLLPNSTYLVRMIAQKIYGNPEVITLAPNLMTAIIPPTILATRADSITDTSARLSARLNANGTASTYRFDYGEVGGFTDSVPLPEGSLGSGHSVLFVEQAIAGLKPDTEYQYRVVGTSTLAGPETGPTKTFTTKAVADPSSTRAYELVSPADKLGGAGVGEWYRGPASLAASGFAAYSGERFAAQGSFGSMLLDSPQAYANDWAFAERIDGESGWASHSPISRPSLGQAFASFIILTASSEDLSRFAVWSNGTLNLFPEVLEPGWQPAWNIPYLLDWGGEAGSRIEPFGPSDPALADTGTQSVLWSTTIADGGARAIGQTSLTGGGVASVRGMAGATDPTKAGFDDLAAGRSLYAADTSAAPSDTFAGSGRELVNVCSGAGAARTRVPGVDGSGLIAPAACAATKTGRSERLVSDRGAALTGFAGSGAPPEDVVSANGRRVFFLSPDPAAAGVPGGTAAFCTATGQTCPPQLYVRQFNPDGTRVTRWISRPAVAGQAGSLLGTARFEGASADGDKVFFRTNSPLSADDPNATGATAPVGGVKTGSASADSWDLYLYDFPDAPGADPGTGTLTRISAGPPGGDDGDCNSPYNPSSLDTTAALRFLSKDGSRAYFTCAKALAGVSGAPSGGITTPASGADPASETNLYLYDANLAAADRWRFIARLPRSTAAGLDACASTGYSPAGPIKAEAQRSQFEISGSAGASANCVRGNAEGTFITLFTPGRLSADDPKTGPLTGDVYGYEAERDELSRLSAAQGGAGGTYACAPGSGAAQCNGDGGVDSQSSALAGPVNTALGVATDPLVPGAHVAFFQTRSRLLAADTDDAYDVYEWADGKLSLLSPDTPTDALYKGNDRSGRNVFFASRDALSWQDFDAVGDIYSARVGSGIAEPEPPPACAVLIGACKGAQAGPPPTQGAASGVFSGQGNATAAPERAGCARAARSARKLARRARQLNRLAARRSGKAAKRARARSARLVRRSRKLNANAKRCRAAARAANAEWRAGR